MEENEEVMRVGCEDCTKCYNSCKSPFPDKYIDGSVDCPRFDLETIPEIVYSNMETYVNLTRTRLAEEGLYV